MWSFVSVENIQLRNNNYVNYNAYEQIDGNAFKIANCRSLSGAAINTDCIPYTHHSIRLY